MSAAESPSSLRDSLRSLFGHDDFRAGQREIVEAALAGEDTLAVLPTGGGKSLTYQLPAMLGSGATLVLSPLIALMKDQAENLPPEVAARTTIINSSLESSEVGRRLAQVKAGRIKMVYAAPERLRQPPFLHALRQAQVSLVVVDEAHCISQWGHDFRPDYRAVGKAVASLSPRSVLAVTATATPEVQDDIERQLGRPLRRFIRATYRDNLYLACRRVQGEDEKLWATLDICRDSEGAGLVYAGSREKCERLARMLKNHGVAAGFYHAGLPPEERAAAQDRFMRGEVRVMAATVAFGMGVDKSDIRFLVHYHPSRTLENYYQEAGRAGRDGKPSRCVLLHSAADAASATRHLREDTLTLESVRSVYQVVRQALGRRRCGPVAFGDLAAGVGGDENLVRAALPLLEEAGLLARHVDLPRRLSIYPDYAGDSGGLYGDEMGREPDPDWPAFAAALGAASGPEVDAQELSEATGVPLPDLESVILRLQDARHLTYRASGREFLLELLPPPPDAKNTLAGTLEHRRRGAEERAAAMLDYARARKCRHGMVARYFGDRWPNLKCGACDVCGGTDGHAAADEEEEAAPRSSRRSAGHAGNGSSGAASGGGERLDPAEAPRVALKLVADLAQGYRPFALGRAGLVKALRGTPDAPIKRGRADGFGALAEYKKAEVERLVDALVDAGLLRRDEDDEYRRLYLTSDGADSVRAGDVDIPWRVAAPAAPGKGAAAGKSAEVPEDVDPDLLEALREWRREVAQGEGLPAYCILADKALVGLAAARPTNEFGLLAIPGIGPAKAAKYGEALLEIVRKRGGGG